MEENNLKSAVEALIFASEKPITAEQIKKVLGDLDAPTVNRIIVELKNEYEAKVARSDSGCALFFINRFAE